MVIELLKVNRCVCNQVDTNATLKENSQRSQNVNSAVLESSASGCSQATKTVTNMKNNDNTTYADKVKTNSSGKTIIGTKSSALLTGVKKAWFHLGRLKGDTSVEQVKEFLNETFPDIPITVEKLDSKGFNSSFKLGTDFTYKDTLMHSDGWPCNATLRRFLFRFRRDLDPPSHQN